VEDHRLAHELRAHRLDDRETTLAEILKLRGYATAAFAGGPWLHPTFGLLQGYDHRWFGSDTLSGARADAVTNAAIEWIASVPADRPIHLLVNYFDPHRPYDPPPGYDSLPGAQERGSVSDADVIRLGEMPAPERRRVTARYDGEIRFMDHHFGDLVDALQGASRFEDALIILVGDHGEAFGELGAIGHTYWLYEPILRVPLIVRSPRGRDGGSHDDRPVSVADLLPMIARTVSFELPEPIDGMRPGERKFVFAELQRSGTNTAYDRDLVAVIRWPWKLIASTDGREEILRLDGETLEERTPPPPGERDALRQALASLPSAREASGSVPAVEPPEEVRDQLRALGYIE
jgi:arylsulfatase A-like enzyme